MIPLLAAKGIGKMTKGLLGNKYVMLAIILVIILFFFKGKLKRVIQKIRENKFDKNETDDANLIAQQYRAAANPSGISWMIDIDGTSEEAVERLAYQTKGKLDKVTNAYRQKFGETLSDRMRKELSAKEYSNWQNIIS